MAEEEKLTFGQACGGFFGNHWRGVVIIVVPSLLSFLITDYQAKDFCCLYIVCVMALFWITECIPLYLTSMMPIFLFPIFNIMSSHDTCKQYLKDSIVLFVGGLIIAQAIEVSNLHKRVALKTIQLIGCSPRRLHFGLMCTTSFISFWVANSAACSLMCPIIVAVLDELHAQGVVNQFNMDEPFTPDERPPASRISLAFFLGTAYGASIGGCATLIGTGTNAVFKGLYEGRFKERPYKAELDFPRFMYAGTPMVCILTVLVYFCLEFQYMGLCRPNSTDGQAASANPEVINIARKVIDDRYTELGPFSIYEIQVLIIFLLMIFLLFMMKPGFITGWGVISPRALKSATPMIALCIMCFILPVNYSFLRLCFTKGPFPTRSIQSILNWRYSNAKTPWGLLFLLGGGYALSAGADKSGMSEMVATALQSFERLPHSVVQLFGIVISIFLTNFSANVAICNIVVPILMTLCIKIKIMPLYICLPSCYACSLAYHLPVGTPPNAIITGFANIKSKHLAAGGAMPSLVSVLMLFLNGQLWQPIIFPGIVAEDWVLNAATKK